ncbi:DoxX protein [Amycolatopsis regifaucium]|nr:DoxX protein [Amycolatopsis regifaucium]
MGQCGPVERTIHRTYRSLYEIRLKFDAYPALVLGIPSLSSGRAPKEQPMLSHHDRQELEKIERWFELTEPALAARLRSGKPAPPPLLRLAVVLSIDVTAGLLMLLGLVTNSPALLLVGMITVTAAVIVHLSRFGRD